MKKITTTLKDLSFYLYAKLELEESGSIKRILSPNRKNVLYSIVVDGIVVYIGKTNNLKKRVGYYRTSTNRTTKHSDAAKSDYIHDCLAKGMNVEIWYRQCFVIPIKQDVGTLTISTMDLEEPIIVNILKPILNTHYRKGNKNDNCYQQIDK